ncbi:hypothetical protein [Litorimonas haliclonae]|uniref:hypothetical protein n=1 Tax=Litorimonas haliclonae TaxID=2081977 RepID=UPI0039F0C84D
MTFSSHSLFAKVGLASLFSLGIVSIGSTLASGAKAQQGPASANMDEAQVESKVFALPKEAPEAVLAATAIPPARNLSTQDSDRTLTNNCVEGGYEKEECLCATQILKYELPLREYDAAALIFALESDPDSTDESLNREEARAELYKKGFSETELADLDRMNRSLMDASDFARRCHEASAYFSPPAEG